MFKPNAQRKRVWSDALQVCRCLGFGPIAAWCMMHLVRSLSRDGGREGESLVIQPVPGP